MRSWIVVISALAHSSSLPAFWAPARIFSTSLVAASNFCSPVSFSTCFQSGDAGTLTGATSGFSWAISALGADEGGGLEGVHALAETSPKRAECRSITLSRDMYGSFEVTI